MSGDRHRVPGSFGRSILEATARGGGLVALAVLIGIVLLQVSDTSGPDPLPAARVADDGADDGTVDETPASSTTTTTAAVRAPADVSVLVVNASGRAGVAKAMSDRLAVVGYTTLTPGDAPGQKASSVACRPDLGREADALASATGLSPTSAAFDSVTELEGAGDADCVLLIGSG